VAKEILGNLIQYNKLDHESVPLKYNIVARNYTLIKLKGQMNIAILDSLKKLNMNELKLIDLNKIMEEIEADGLITIKKKGKYFLYELKKELELSNEGKKQYSQVLQPLVDWPTGFFRSFYNIRELNPILSDMCYIPFQPNSFDAIVSISALQWIYKDLNAKKMRINLISLFKSFYAILKPKSKAVFQFYPKSKVILDSIGKIIVENTNFNGNFIIDNPDSPKKRKIYLFLKKE